MKRLGVQKSVIVMRDLVSGMVYACVWSLLASFIFWGFILNGKLGLGVIIIASILHTLQIGLRGIIISQLVPGKLASMLTVSIFFIQFALAPVLIGADVPNPGLATIGCIISPYLQLNLLYHLGIVQYT